MLLLIFMWQLFYKHTLVFISILICPPESLGYEWMLYALLASKAIFRAAIYIEHFFQGIRDRF